MLHVASDDEEFVARTATVSTRLTAHCETEHFRLSVTEDFSRRTLYDVNTWAYIFLGHRVTSVSCCCLNELLFDTAIVTINVQHVVV